MNPTRKCKLCISAFVWLTLIGITACASLDNQIQQEAFDRISNQYRRALLASDFEAALNMTSSPSAVALPALKNIQVVSYSLRKAEFSEDRSKVLQEVELEYYRTDSMLQKSMRDHQEWIYEPGSKTWVLTSGLPQFNR
jgi:hypothetical protein